MYKKVYDRGPLDDREPLYHSNPFFMEVNGHPAKDHVYGLFIDNPSQVMMDLSYLDVSKYMFGIRFGDLDYYVFAGKSCAEVITIYSSIFGAAYLKPRYVLGYHQGCYGYDTRQILEEAAHAYRANQIPCDGLHIDVDLQHQYQTFTINQEAFPNPADMFARLRHDGFKCSTNITPIISNKDLNYATYATGLAEGYFIKDRRVEPQGRDRECYQDYIGGTELRIYERDLLRSNYNNGEPFIGEVYYGQANGQELGTEGHYPDFGRREVREWWGEQYRYLFDMGLEFVWQDMTTPAVRNTRGDMCSLPFKLLLTDDFIRAFEEDRADGQSSNTLTPALKIWNLFSYNLHKATFEGLGKLSSRENKRNFIIGRGSFAGVGRYSGLWTGDNASTWEFLRITIPQVLSIGLSGQAITGSDVGGFEQGTPCEQWPDPELVIRWTAVGAFLPWFRNHYMRKGHKLFQEPYAYATLDLDRHGLQSQAEMYRSVLPVCKYYIELRYRLMQLFYDCLFENTISGLPICRALVLVEHQDKALFNDKIDYVNNEFLVGDDLLVAPVLEPQNNENNYGKRDVYLPAGSRWYSYMDNRQPLCRAFEGGTTIYAFDAHISRDPGHVGFIVPLFVRAGAIIPTLDVEQYVGELHDKGLPHPLTLNVYPGQTGSYTLYLDDGVSRSSAQTIPVELGGDPMARAEYRQTSITHCYQSDMLRRICIKRLHDNYTLPEPFFFVAMLHDPCEISGPMSPIRKITVNGNAIPQLAGSSTSGNADAIGRSEVDAWYFNPDINVSFVKVNDVSGELIIEAEYSGPIVGY